MEHRARTLAHFAFILFSLNLVFIAIFSLVSHFISCCSHIRGLFAFFSSRLSCSMVGLRCHGNGLDLARARSSRSWRAKGSRWIKSNAREGDGVDNFERLTPRRLEDITDKDDLLGRLFLGTLRIFRNGVWEKLSRFDVSSRESLKHLRIYIQICMDRGIGFVRDRSATSFFFWMYNVYLIHRTETRVLFSFIRINQFFKNVEFVYVIAVDSVISRRFFIPVRVVRDSVVPLKLEHFFSQFSSLFFVPKVSALHVTYTVGKKRTFWIPGWSSRGNAKPKATVNNDLAATQDMEEITMSQGKKTVIHSYENKKSVISISTLAYEWNFRLLKNAHHYSVTHIEDNTKFVETPAEMRRLRIQFQKNSQLLISFVEILQLYRQWEEKFVIWCVNHIRLLWKAKKNVSAAGILILATIMFLYPHRTMDFRSFFFFNSKYR